MTNLRRVVGWVTVVTVILAGCRKADEPAPTAAPRVAEEMLHVRYDCFIVRNLGGKDDIVASSGFPKVVAAADLPEDEHRATPAAARRAQLMGTEVGIAVYGMDAEPATAAVDAGLARIAELSEKLNLFSPASAVSRINRDAYRTPVKLDDDLDRVIRLSFRVSELSGGAFDVTVGPLTSLWRKCRAEKRLAPEEEVKRARDLVGYTMVKMSDGPEMAFSREGMSFDFGGVAKGFAAEEAAKVLARHGVRSAIIDCGGDLKLIGSRPGGNPFRVGINDPDLDADSSIRYVVLLTDIGVVTSGNYRQFTMIEGKRHSHIIDPRTGESIEALPSVTVIGPDAGMCDALATAVSVLGEEEGLRLIDRVNAQK